MASNSSQFPSSNSSRYTISSALNSETAATTPDSGSVEYPDATVVHHYTHCQHTSPPENRPLNQQPTLVHSNAAGTAPVSTLLGRCYNCDLAYCRQQETEVLQRYHDLSRALQLRLIAAREILQTIDFDSEVDEDGIDKIVADTDTLVRKREAEVKTVWSGFSRRWGPGTVGVRPGLTGGRMDVKWERPAKK